MRIRSLDLARGFTVLCMPAVHTLLLYSQPAVRESLPGQLLGAIAEGPGAPLFMTIMGISLTLSTRLSWPQVLRRSAGLLLAGYGLNMVKFVLPLLCGGLPLRFQTDLGITTGCSATETVLVIGDILHFAALALPITYAVSRLPHYGWAAGGAALAVLLAAPYTWDIPSCSPLAHYAFQLIGGQPPAVYFPLFPWLTYPLAGLAIGYLLKKEIPDFFLALGMTGIVLIATGELVAAIGGPSTNFYRTGPGDTLLHLGIVLMALCGWDIAARYIRPNALLRLCQYASRNITQVYVIQWPLICWGLPLFGYQRLPYHASLYAAALLTGITLTLSLFISAATKNGIQIDE